MQYPPLRIFWYSRQDYESSIEEMTLDSTQVRVYSAEKTLADCFKYRSKLGIDVCTEALNLYRQHGRMKLDQIEQFAKVCRVERVMRPYREAILLRRPRSKTWALRFGRVCELSFVYPPNG
jgi:hypothetical protein